MFEDKTYENIMDEMLANVDTSIDTREGSIVHETIAPIGMELEQVYADLGLVLDECFADTASYYYLIKRCAERGIIVKEGDYAVIKVLAEPTSVEIEIGAEFTIGQLSYTATENLGNGYYNLTCEQSGVEGNNMTDDIIPNEDIEDLESITAVEIVVAGSDDEDVDSLRERYFASFKEVAFGGNQADYKEKALSYPVVKGCKVYPVWNGGGTVKLKILGVNYRSASSSVIEYIQNEFDPTLDGTGLGLAPIGHVVTVDTATEIPINITATVTYEAGTTWDNIKDNFTTKFENHLLDLRKTWDDTENLFVRVGDVERIFLDIVGVEDVTNILINGTNANLQITDENIPVGGEYHG